MKFTIPHIYNRRGRSSKIGLVPGTPVYLGEERHNSVTLDVLTYNEKETDRRSFTSVEEALAMCHPDRVIWINVDGIHDAEKINKLGEYFHLHPLTREDIMNSNHRP